MDILLTLLKPLAALVLLAISFFGAEVAHYVTHKYKLHSSFYLWSLFLCFSFAVIGFYYLLLIINDYLSQTIVGMDWNTFLYEPVTGGGLVLFALNVFLISGIGKFGIYPMIRDFEQLRKERRQWESRQKDRPEKH